jgi:restriction endonuclease Mrr
VIAGLLEATNGGHALTPLGREALAEHPDGMDRADLAQFPDYAEHIRRQAALARPREDPHQAAYLQGAAARVAGRSLTDNPHPPETGDHGAWEDGWSED